MPFARCPICEDILTLGSPLNLNQPVTCSTCLANLMIVGLEPLELEEANRRPPRAPGGYAGKPNYSGARREPAGPRPGGSDGNHRPQGAPAYDRRLPPQSRPQPVFPPNPDKLVDGRRAQKWEKPKEREAGPEEHEETDDLEGKLDRSRGGKKKRSK